MLTKPLTQTLTHKSRVLPHRATTFACDSFLLFMANFYGEAVLQLGFVCVLPRVLAQILAVCAGDQRNVGLCYEQFLLRHKFGVWFTQSHPVACGVWFGSESAYTYLRGFISLFLTHLSVSVNQCFPCFVIPSVLSLLSISLCSLYRAFHWLRGPL
jgi:hypothetical protein